MAASALANIMSGDATDNRVTNSEEVGMGHGRMGWLESSPAKFFSGAAQRNSPGIGKVLTKHLGDSQLDNGLVIEVGSGSGQHVAHFAPLLPMLQFQPTEFAGLPNPLADCQDEERILASIAEYTKDLPNVLAPLALDASELASAPLCADGEAACIIAVNVVHISPHAVFEGIIQGAGKKLKPGVGVLIFYGPWAIDGVISGEGNQRFDQTLKNKDAAFGLRDTAELKRLGSLANLEIVELVHFEESGNHAIVLRRT